MAITVQMRTEVSQLYVALFGRAPDGEGLGFWVSLRDQGQSLAQIANTMYATTPARTYFPSFLTNTEIINSFYSNVLGRAADAEGSAFWTAKLNAAGATPGSVIAEMIGVVAGYGGADPAGVTSKNLFNNKVTVAQYYGEKNGNIAGAQSVLTTVTADTASVTAAQASIDSGTVGGVNQGVTMTLTANTDVVSGTNGNDTFIAGLVGAAATLTAGDSVNGGSGTDRLNTFGNDNATAVKTATLTGIEAVYAQMSAGTLEVQTNSGVTQAWIAGGSDGANTVNLNKAQTAGVQGTQTANVQTFAFQDVTGPADSATLALEGTTGATGVTIAGVETLNISATGTSSIGALTAAATTTLNVGGAGKVTAVPTTGTFKTIDASTNTGGIVFDISALGATDHAIKGSKAADEVTINQANLTKLDSIDLGDGTDTLGFATGNVSIAAANTGDFVGVKAEAYKFNGAITAAVDADATDVGTFIVNTTGAQTYTNMSNTDKVSVLGVAVAASTAAVKLGQNTLNLDLTGGAAAGADLSGGLTVTGSTTVNLTSNGTATGATNKLTTTVADNNTFNLTGSKDLTLVVTGAGGVTGQTIQAGSFTGKLTVTATALADIVVSGSGADTITAGDGIDTITGGGGKDKFVFASADIDTAAGAVTDTITDFVSGTDTIGGSWGAASAANYLEATAAVADLATMLAAADVALAGAVKYYVGQVGSDSYLVTDNDFTGYTEVIKLTGVALTGIAQADVVA